MNKEKIEKLHKLSNFGKLSAGIIHDLASPLNALLINLEKVNDINKNKKINYYLKQANNASLNLKNILISAKNQVKSDDEKEKFYIKNEIDKILLILNYQIKQENIKLLHNIDKNLNIYGSKIKFNRIISNLIINAIEACKKTRKKNKSIYIEALKKNNIIIIKIIDNGCGISNELKNKLFHAFVSEKNSLGLGLYLVKKILEDDFSGQIENINENNKTIFQIKFNC